MMRSKMCSSFSSMALASLWALHAQVALAAEPAAGTISPAAPQTSFESGPFLTSGGVFCSATNGCDSYLLTAELPANYDSTNPKAFIRFGLGWDFKLDLFTFTLTDVDTGEDLATSESGDLGSATIYIPAGAGTRNLRLDITPAAANNSVIFGKVSLGSGEGDGLVPNPVGPGVPRYQVYAPPEALSGNTGEPSVGYNQTSKQAFILSGLKTLWAVFPQDLTPAQPLACEGEWDERSSPVTSATTLDPIGITDSLVRGHETRRSIVGQLVGPNSAAAYSDDDGATWIPVEGGPPVAAVDHQTYGAGPYPADHPFGIAGNPIYPNAIYYCGQDVGFASCARSDNGGISFGPATPLYTIEECAGIHGHVRVAPDGTVYVPSKACGPNVALSVSTDAGNTWVRRPAPDSVPAIRDPSVALAADNTAYFCYSSGDGRATVSVSKDRGVSFAPPVELGAEMGIKHVMFTHAIAGDADRATCAYVGTSTLGNPVALDFPGTWYLYFSTTYDGGQTWTTVNAAPFDPVQGVGGIWNSGGGSINRNLLDFNEISIDERGYPLYGYADGCIGGCDINPAQNTFAAFPKIARQIAGKSLYSEFDTTEPRVPAPACLSGTRTPERTQLNWRVPENGGAAISGYKIFRGLAPGAEELIGTSDGTPGYIDLSADPAVEKYYYKVTALSGVGEGMPSNTAELSVAVPDGGSACGIPGLRLITDASGDANVPAADLISLHAAEPPEMPDLLLFQLKVAELAATPAGTMWTVRFYTPGQNPAEGNSRFIGMVADGTGVQFVHGTAFSTALVIAGYTEYTVEGTLDPASSFAPDGTISLVLPRSLYELTAGQQLFGFSINTHTGATASGMHIVRSTNTLDSAIGSSSYTLRAANACEPNSAPMALFTATPDQGTAPLEVTLDASGSHDAEDAIVEYVFDFGDQTPQLTQSTPQASHRYLEKGFYRVTLQVKDARGKLSENVAQAVIDTTGPAAAPTAPVAPEAPDDGRYGGGAWGGAALLLLGLAARLRRNDRQARNRL